MKRRTSVEIIVQRIFHIRGRKVLLSIDLAALYGVEPKALMQAVRRNIDRFPADLLFPLTDRELGDLKFRRAASSRRGIRRAALYAFTAQGVAMLSSVLNSERAVQANIAIMRAFGTLRELMASRRDLARKLDEMERRHDGQYRAVFEVIRQLIAGKEEPKSKTGSLHERQHAGKKKRMVFSFADTDATDAELEELLRVLSGEEKQVKRVKKPEGRMRSQE